MPISFRNRVAEVVPLKQGLKPNHEFSKSWEEFEVAEVVPLKQGLKQNRLIVSNVIQTSCRGSSIKTRIETPPYHCLSFLICIVAEVVPLKQGLKQKINASKKNH